MAKMNVKLLRRVKNRFLKYPETLRMSHWAQKHERDKEHPCGTTGCIAGHICQMEKDKLTPGQQRSMEKALTIQLPSEIHFSFERNAAKFAGLTRDQARRLFYVERWPLYYEDEYWKENSGSRERAEVVAKRIEHFIKTGE